MHEILFFVATGVNVVLQFEKLYMTTDIYLDELYLETTCIKMKTQLQYYEPIKMLLGFGQTISVEAQETFFSMKKQHQSPKYSMFS